MRPGSGLNVLSTVNDFICLFNAILFYLPKVPSLGEIGKHKFYWPKLKRFHGVMSNKWLYLLILVPNNPLYILTTRIE